MTPEVEARYLTIDWRGPGDARSVRPSDLPIAIEPGSDAVPELELDLFPDDFSWLGLRPAPTDKTSPPEWTTGDGRSHRFTPVADGHGATWWVPALDWNEASRRHINAFARSLGDFEIMVGAVHLRVRTVAHAGGRTVLEDYLRSFRDTLIWLIFGFEGTGTVAGGARAGGELVAALEAFSAAMATVSRHLATEIRERTGEMERHKVRPGSATFRHHGRNPAARRLPGRLAVETADLPDNRHLRHMADQCSRLLPRIHDVTRRQAAALRRLARREMERADACERIEHHQVDPEIFDVQLAELERRLDRVRTGCADDDTPPGAQCRDFPLRLISPYARRTNEFFYQRLDDAPNEPGIAFRVARFPDTLGTSLFAVLPFSRDYIFGATKADIQSSIEETAAGKSYRLLEFRCLRTITPRTSALENKRHKRARLERNGWRSPLGRGEKDEFQRAAASARKRARALEDMADRAEASSGPLAQATATLRGLDADFERRGIARASRLPASMRFSTNPHYAACLNTFRQVQALMSGAGVTEDALAGLDRIGTVHASALYERWCLVKILTILISDYGFVPPMGWQQQMIETVLGQSDPLTLKLFRPDIGLTAHLDYQVPLANGRRPDYRLRFLYRPSGEAAAGAGPAGDRGHRTAGGLIMDAKFRTRWQPGELQSVVDSLVDQKRYDIEGDRVFILHPVPGSIVRPTSPLAWGRDCDYGQAAETNHRRGSVCVSPALPGGDDQVHLRRLIALQLQSTFGLPAETDDRDIPSRHEHALVGRAPESPRVAPATAEWTRQSFCISCGRQHSSADISIRRTKAHNPYWTFVCADCTMTSTRTHCYACGEDLFKNHIQLTYHNTIADQITNVMCPACGAYFDADWSGP